MNQSTDEISFSQSQIVWNYIFLIVLFLIIILNNSLILTAVLTQRRLQSQINFIILASLSTAQLFGGLLSLPNIVLVEDYQNGVGLKFARVVTTFCGTSSQLHLTALCVDRCFALLDPIRYNHLKRGTVAIAVVITWLLSVVGSVLSVVDFKNYSVFVVVMFFILPLLIDMFGYGLIYHSLSALGKDNQTTVVRKEVRLAKSFSVMTLVFTLFWLPYVITIILSDHCGSCDIPSSHLFLLVLYCQMLSLCFSSLVYYNGSFDFRLAFKNIAKKLRGFLCETGDQRDDVTAESPTTGNGRSGNTSELDASMSGINFALFLDGVDGEHAQKGSVAFHRNNGAQLPQGRTGDEVHIVPFDQTRFFGEIDGEGLSEETGGASPLNMANDLVEDTTSSVGFHDIDIVPYDQSC